MDTVLAGLESTALAEFLRVSRWGYAAVNTAHILGIALLIGAAMTLNLRFLGLWPDAPRRVLVRALAPVAAAGLGLAVVAGLLLFSVRAREYADIGFLQAKLLLMGIGTASALRLHWAHGWSLDGASQARLRGHAVVSSGCWLGALICGRLIAFAE